MNEEEKVDGKAEFFEEDDFRVKINRAYLSLEIRITIDHLKKNTGARLVSQQGRAIDIHPKTLQCYYGLRSLIYDYTQLYGKNAELEAMRDRWGVLNQKR